MITKFSVLYVGQIELDSDGYVVTHDDVHTRVEGVFACGDVRLSLVKRVASAVGEGSMAIAFVRRYLANEGQA